jgi:hypothetical protein
MVRLHISDGHDKTPSSHLRPLDAPAAYRSQSANPPSTVTALSKLSKLWPTKIQHRDRVTALLRAVDENPERFEDPDLCEAVLSLRLSAAPSAFGLLTAAFLPFSNRHNKCKHFLSCFSCFLVSALSFVRPHGRFSSAPTAGFRRRRAQKLSRPAVALTWPHAPPFRGRALTASSTLDDHGPKQRSVVECGLLWVSLAWIDCRCQIHRSLRGPGSLAAPWPSGFRRRYVPALNKRSVQEALRGRRGPSQRGQHSTARCGESYSIASGGWRCSFSVPLERRARGPHPMQDDGKLAGDRHGCLLSSDAFAKDFAPGLQRAWSR